MKAIYLKISVLIICFFLFFTKLIENHKILDPQNTRENLGPTKHPREKIWTQEIPARKNLDQRNTHERPTRSTEFSALNIWLDWYPTLGLLNAVLLVSVEVPGVRCSCTCFMWIDRGPLQLYLFHVNCQVSTGVALVSFELKENYKNTQNSG